MFVRNPDVQITTATFTASQWTSTSISDSKTEGTPGVHVSFYPMSETKVASVISNVNEGVVAVGTEVTLQCGTDDAIIMYALSTDDTEPTSYVEYSTPIVINEAVTIWTKASKSGMEDSDVISFTYSVPVLNTIADVRESVGTKTIVEGVITARDGNYDVYIQDETAGIIASQYKSGAFAGEVGDKIRVEGTIAAFYDNAQIQPASPTDVTIIDAGHGLPSPKNITPAQLSNDVEGMLVKLTDVTVTAVDDKGNVTVSDANNNTGIVMGEVAALTVGKTIESIQGVVNYNYNIHKVKVLSADDIVEDSSKTLAPKFSISGGTVESGTSITLSSDTEGASIYFETGADEASTQDPTTSSAVYESAITIDETSLYVKAYAVKDGLSDSDVAVASFTIGDLMRIRDIQGLSHTSPKVGQEVANIQGIVTAISTDKYVKGFFMQEPDASIDNDPKTSEGIFVSTSYTKMKVGDLVSIKGTVTEKKNDSWDGTLKETQIVATWVETLSSDQPIPAAVVIGEGGLAIPNDIIDNDSFAQFDPEEDGIDFYESLEGMLIQINDPAIVGADERYGEVYVLADGGSASSHKLSDNGSILLSDAYQNPELITLDDVLNPITNSSTKEFYDKTFTPKPGDSFQASIKGIVSYGFGKYKIYNTETLPSVKDSGLQREITSIMPEEDKLTVSAYNIENFDPSDGQEKSDKIAESIVTNLRLPDIIALVEIQDNDGATNSSVVEADQSYQFLIDSISKESLRLTGTEVTYKFTDIAPIEDTEGGEPGGNIRVGYIYREDRVSLVNPNRGGSDEAVSIVDGHLSRTQVVLTH